MPSNPFGHTVVPASRRLPLPQTPVIPLLKDGTPKPSPFALHARRLKKLEAWRTKQRFTRSVNDN